ncbi:hypothetical protein B7C51_04995 [Paenibacillus larvae subsp. pulvifaciens]|uniref:HTH cro/C1-type domain-containing protein n=1 Tax=Paenibacillus larvae subsp. pulvifaciens TaxID=1477 RepID=A0A1V0UQE4_9BACL|nr:helix-turn-helix transcriptional regulator [Paenibacillus larvae]ARF67327.1 hypothetical protein B7C51_04995 [Paenibacillus larvae subsp. pulvifaciens]
MNKIRLLRKEKKLSGIYIAEQMGITPQYYYDIERGKRSLNSKNAVKLSEILGVTVESLFDEPIIDEINQIENSTTKRKGPNRIRKLRKLKNIKASTIAKKLGISTQHYYNIERGDSFPDAKKVTELAAILNVTTDYLLGFYYDDSNDNPHSKKNKYLSDEEMKKIPISDLENYRLEYKGKELTNEQKKHVIELLKHALEMNKEN